MLDKTMLRDKTRDEPRDKTRDKPRDIIYQTQDEDAMHKIPDDIRQDTYTG